MSAGLFGLLDDVAALVKLTAASVDDISGAAGRATAKAAGVVVDDTAVTPQYVEGIAAEREVPMIKRIALGSLRNKLLLILPGALLLSQIAPWLVFPVLMLWCYLPVLRRRREGLACCPRSRRGLGAVGFRRSDGVIGDPDRLHTVRRDHGDRPQ